MELKKKGGLESPGKVMENDKAKNVGTMMQA